MAELTKDVSSKALAAIAGRFFSDAMAGIIINPDENTTPLQAVEYVDVKGRVANIAAEFDINPEEFMNVLAMKAIVETAKEIALASLQDEDLMSLFISENQE